MARRTSSTTRRASGAAGPASPSKRSAPPPSDRKPAPRSDGGGTPGHDRALRPFEKLRELTLPKQRGSLSSGPRRLLLAEFLLCMAILVFTPLGEKHKDEPAGAFMKRSTALLAVFFLLGLVSAGGRGAAKAAAGFGGLVTLGLLITNRDVVVKLGQRVGSTDDTPTDAGPPGEGEDPDALGGENVGAAVPGGGPPDVLGSFRLGGENVGAAVPIGGSPIPRSRPFDLGGAQVGGSYISLPGWR